MAKQTGIHQLNGKMRGVSYYRQKGVQDGLARTINQGMSKRVKEDAAYENTRLNAAEFGSAGSFAGACIRGISDRQRAMLKDFATGQLAKVVRDLIQGDTSHKWGERTLDGIQWQAYLRDVISTFAKVDFSSNVGGVWDVEVSADDDNFIWTPNAELAEGWGSLLAAKGATGAIIDMHAYKVSLEDLGGKSHSGVVQVAPIAQEDATIGTAVTITTPATRSSIFDGVDKSGVLTGVLVVVKPYQEINGEKYIRQELCTYALLPVTLA